MKLIILIILLTTCSISTVCAQDADDHTLDSLISVYNSMDDADTNKMVLCKKICVQHYNPDSTIMWSDRLVRLSILHHNDFMRAKAYGYYSWAYTELNRFDTAMFFNYKALLVADSIGNEEIKADNYFNLAVSYYELSNYDISNNYYLKALDYFINVNDYEGCANCYKAIADNYTFLKMYDEAIELYKRALHIDSTLNKMGRVASEFRGMGRNYYRNFILNFSKSNFELLHKSVECYKMAYDANPENVKSRLISACYLSDALFLEYKLMDYDSKKRASILDTMNMLCNSIDTLILKIDYGFADYISSLSKIYYQIATSDFQKARNNLDLVERNLLRNISKSEIEKFYWANICYYEAVGDYKSASHFKSLFYECLINETSVDLAIESAVNQQRIEYEHTIAEKEAQMGKLAQRVAVVISFILLLVGFLVFLYFRNSKHNKLVEQKNVLLRSQREEIASQRDSLISQNKIITDSLNYAKTIQIAVQPKEDFMRDLFYDYFVIYKPLHIVSGDFFWARRRNGRNMLVCADCTGHGVPGGFLSMLGVSILNDLTAILDPDITAAQILDTMRAMLMKALGQSKQKYDNGIIYSMDGIDLALVMIDEAKGNLQYAGAYRPLLIWRDGDIITYKPDKMPIGLYLGPEKDFTNNVIDIMKGDMLYLFSDGMPDQFGYVDDKREECQHFSTRRFTRLLKQVGPLTLEEQKSEVERAMLEWRNGYQQLDDNILIGVRV